MIAWLSWEWVFYFCSILGTIWYFLWRHFVYDSPAKHPDIDADECEFIENSLDRSTDKKNVRYLDLLISTNHKVVMTRATKP